MGFIKGGMIIIIGLVILIALFPVYNEFIFQIGTIFSDPTVYLLCGAAVLLIVVVLVLQFFQQFNQPDFGQIGGSNYE